MSRASLRCRLTDSLTRLPRRTPTDGRTDGRTKNLQDLGDSLTYLNAHEKSGRFRREVVRETPDEPNRTFQPEED